MRFRKNAIAVVLIMSVAASVVVMPVLAIDKPYLTATYGSGLPTPPDDPTTLEWDGTVSGTHSTTISVGADVVCDGALCHKIDFYAEFWVVINYKDSYGGADGYTLEASFRSQNGALADQANILCRGAVLRGWDTCAAHGYLLIPAELVNEDGGLSEAVLTMKLLGNSAMGTVEIWDIQATISAAPINTDDCDDAFEEIGIGQGGELDPTSETGDQATGLEVGSTYKLSVSGGPWISADAPTVDRYDVALKADDEEWQPAALAQTEENVQCVQNGLDDHSFSMVFEATADDFSIRVNDLVGAFADNSYSDPESPIVWEIIGVQEIVAGAGGCSGQFLQGDLLGTYTIDANNEAGVLIDVGFPGDWVEVVVDPATSWQDDGAGPELKTLALHTSTWFPLDVYGSTECADTDTGIYYFQVLSRDAHRLRVNDTGVDWASNTGSLTVSVYSANYQPYPAECESQYRVGEIIETKVVRSESSTGLTMYDGQDTYPPLDKGGESEDVYRYLMMEIVYGPFWDGTGYSAATEVYYGPTGNWFPSVIFPTATCVSVIDHLGRTRIYFPFETSILAKTSATPWKFRAKDGDSSWVNNVGTIGYSLYYADLLSVDNCDNFYTITGDGTELTLVGNDETGTALMSLETESIYAIETSGGPWGDGGVNKYTIAISADDGTTWESVHDSDLFICKTEEGNYITTFFQAQLGADYRLRVDDEAGDFGNNTGWMLATVYNVDSDLDPWASCANNYVLGPELSVPEDQRIVHANSSTGLRLPLTSGSFYAVEIGESQWMELLGDNYRMAEIRAGTSAWAPFQDAIFAECVVHMPDTTYATADRFRIYFEANTSYDVRVDDQDDEGGVVGIWADNLGQLDLHYYLITGSTDDTNPLPPWWTSACYEPCMRPTSLITTVTVEFGTLGSVPLPMPAVGDWLEYGRCGIQKYFAYCPEHQAALDTIPEYFSSREPFASIETLQELLEFASDQVEAMGWGSEYGDSGGEAEDVYAAEDVVIAPLTDDSPWRGGTITFEPPAMGGETGEADCSDRLLAMMFALDSGAPSQRFVIGYCKVMNTLNTWETMFNMDFYIEVLLGILLIFYLATYWKRLEEIF